MADSAPHGESYLRAALGVGAVIALGAAHALLHHERDPIGHGNVLVDFLPSLAIAFQVALLYVGQRLAARRRWSRSTSIGGAALLGIGCGWIAVSMHSPELAPGHALISAVTVGGSTVAFWALLIFVPSKIAEAKARLLAARSYYREAELLRLRANLHPHFLLNTLNAIAGLLVTAPDEARRLLSALGDLLRDSLDPTGEMTTLGEEIEWLRRYAEIFEIRHRGQIRFDWGVAPDTLAARVPRLLVQPLFENAIEHGALCRGSGGTVGLVCRVRDRMLHIAVRDDGPGLTVAAKEGRSTHLGLRLVQDRLKAAYPAATMAIDSSERGTEVTLELPLESGA
jgi:signal transduction histidine kinase